MLQLYNKFPNMAMVLGLVGTAPPTLKVNPSTANFTIPGHVNVFVVDQNKTAETAFVLGMVSVTVVLGMVSVTVVLGMVSVTVVLGMVSVTVWK